MKRKEKFDIAVALSCILQTGLNVIVPVVICYLFAGFLINRFSFPDFTKVVAIILGVFSGAYNMFRYIYTLINRKR